MKKVYIENGYYLFKISNMLKNRNISINKLMRETNTDFKVIKRLLNGDSIKIDVSVIARFCDYFNCSISDLIEYYPNSKIKINS